MATLQGTQCTIVLFPTLQTVSLRDTPVRPAHHGPPLETSTTSILMTCTSSVWLQRWPSWDIRTVERLMHWHLNIPPIAAACNQVKRSFCGVSYEQHQKIIRALHLMCYFSLAADFAVFFVLASIQWHGEGLCPRNIV